MDADLTKKKIESEIKIKPIIKVKSNVENFLLKHQVPFPLKLYYVTDIRF